MIAKQFSQYSKKLVYNLIKASEEISAISPSSELLLTSSVEEGAGIARVILALEQFQECVRYLNTRRSKSATLTDIDSESEVQDVLFMMLRPWIIDLVPENPMDKIASRYSIKDFLSKKMKLVIEAKFIRDKSHGKNISKELHDDIENYRNHPDCESLIFFIYDKDTFIPDVLALKRQIETPRTYSGKQLKVHCIVKP